MPIGDDAVTLNWTRSGNTINYSLKMPQGYKVKIENLSAAEIKLIQ
jgi:hypothetical protein